jgi:hypothetical protein
LIEKRQDHGCFAARAALTDGRCFGGSAGESGHRPGGGASGDPAIRVADVRRVAW